MLSIRELRDQAVIRPIKRAVEDHLLDLPGVVAVDIGERTVEGGRTGEQVIVVSVIDKKTADQLDSGMLIPPSVLGVPTDVVEEQPVVFHEHHWVESSEVPVRCGDGIVSGGGGLAPRRPALAGPSRDAGEFRRVGTLGALVLGDAPTTVTMGLTTFDVACMDDAWSVGDQMIDPTVGHVYADLARAALSGRVNAAAVAIDHGLDHSCVIPGIGAVTGQCAAYPGETVRKSGYGTGVTTGTVVSTDSTLRVDHGEALGVRILREQVRVRGVEWGAPFAGCGDAGAVLVNVEGRVVGLHFATTVDGTSAFACPIADVLAELDVGLCTARSGT
ncbi:hypothetical protein FHX42_004566 [Saccharopolyspora lacisalsi]|uniref:Uncharacterized protein n=1 Tax=Halosaccharopolyspora lacisalsi TaxID=1000566 RepID=A0A839DYZ4_9PSEU|nr:hypothetical protein [Halosaccharopolyspora lacisalsi]MBA8827182.1 hypothetical protein [Halosaccharopolyspora lacisalsi]